MNVPLSAFLNINTESTVLLLVADNAKSPSDPLSFHGRPQQRTILTLGCSSFPPPLMRANGNPRFARIRGRKRQSGKSRATATTSSKKKTMLTKMVGSPPSTPPRLSSLYASPLLQERKTRQEEDRSSKRELRAVSSPKTDTRHRQRNRLPTPPPPPPPPAAPPTSAIDFCRWSSTSPRSVASRNTCCTQNHSPNKGTIIVARCSRHDETLSSLKTLIVSGEERITDKATASACTKPIPCTSSPLRMPVRQASTKRLQTTTPPGGTTAKCCKQALLLPAIHDALPTMMVLDAALALHHHDSSSWSISSIGSVDSSSSNRRAAHWPLRVPPVRQRSLERDQNKVSSLAVATA